MSVPQVVEVDASPWRGEGAFVAGIGASAGGIRAIEELFEALPSDTGIAYVIVQHLSPDHRSMMGEILAKHTDMPVRVAEDLLEVRPNCVYLIPPGYLLRIRDGKLKLSKQKAKRYSDPPIDAFLASLAVDAGSNSIAIVLSGSGSDGSRSAMLVQRKGGLVLVQDPDSAEFSGMPQSCIDTLKPDMIGTPEEIASRLASLPGEILRISGELESDPEATRRVLEKAQEVTGCDFEHHQINFAGLRVTKRILFTRSKNVEAYLKLLDDSVQEAETLALELMLGVTSFFRDPEAFRCLTDNLEMVEPDLKDGDSVFRAWVVGCASGEEAYSIAILLDENIPRLSGFRTFKVFATDIDPQALRTAQDGIFDPSIQQNLSEERLRRYFRIEGRSYRAVERIRNRIVFASHNVIVDPPFTKLHLVSCRNLMLFQREESRLRVLRSLAFALQPARGLLLIGTDEDLGDLASTFDTVDEARKLFRRNEAAIPRPKIQLAPPGLTGSKHQDLVVEERSDHARMLSTLAGEKGILICQLDQDFSLKRTFGSPGDLLQLPEGEITKNIVDLIRDDLRVPVLRIVEKKKLHGLTSVHCEELKAEEDGECSIIDITLKDFHAPGAKRKSYLLWIETRQPGALVKHDPGTLDADSAERIRELETELLEAQESLRSAVQDLRSTNEELQSTNEELTSSNEELQSTNEELHSVNEELHTVNAEHQRKIEEQITLSQDLEHLLNTTEIATVFLDADLAIRRFTPSVVPMIPLQLQDIGRSLAHFQHPFDVDINAIAREVLQSGEPQSHEIRGPHASWMLMRVVRYDGGDPSHHGVVLSLVDITDIHAVQDRLRESERRFRELAENVAEVFWIREATPRGPVDLTYVNPAIETMFGLTGERILENPELWFDAIVPEDRARVREAYSMLPDSHAVTLQYRIAHTDGSIRWLQDQGSLTDGVLGQSESQRKRFAGIAADITGEKAIQQELQMTAKRFEQLVDLDPLTDLLNRRGLSKLLDQEIDRANRSGTRLAAILADCDRFKDVNDRHGHVVGDAVLKEFAKRLQSALRPSDHLGRIGGDEFLVLLPETRLAEATSVAERLRIAVGKTSFRVGGRELDVTASFGVCLVSEDALSLEEVLPQTHAALRVSKHSGRDRVRTLAGDGAEDGIDREAILAGLRSGENLSVFHQMIVSTSDGLAVGYELLTRGPKGPFESPKDLFRLATETNALTAVDLRCFRNCLDAADKMCESTRIHVNIFPSTLLDTSPVSLSKMIEGRFPDERLCIEISEQLFLGDPSYLLGKVRHLRELGVQVAIDDVGFGQSSLESLVLLEPNLIKMDRAFVSGCSMNPAKRRSLERMVRVARSLDATIVAEGVEDAEDSRVVRELGIPFGQGFYWQRPELIAG